MERDLDQCVEAIATAQHGLLTRDQAVEAGATREAIRHRLRAGRW